MAKFENELKAYQVIPNDLIFDNELSDRARFIYCYMACKPQDWQFFLHTMSEELHLSQETIRKNIKDLVNKGWIVKGKQNNENGIFGAVTYILKERPCNKKPVSEKNRDGKNITHKQNRKKNNISNDILLEKIDIPNGFLPIIQEWLQYKTERKEKYVESGLKLFVNKLRKYSNDDVNKAHRIVETSILHNWQGIFELKENNQQQSVNNTYPRTPDDVLEDDIKPYYDYWVYWHEKKIYEIHNIFTEGIFINDVEYQSVINHIKGEWREKLKRMAYAQLDIQRAAYKGSYITSNFSQTLINYFKEHGWYEE